MESYDLYNNALPGVLSENFVNDRYDVIRPEQTVLIYFPKNIVYGIDEK